MGYYTGVKAVLWDILNPIEAVFLLRFIIFHLGYKNPEKKGRPAQLLYVVIWSVIIVVNGVVAPDFPASLILNVLLLLFYARKYLRGSVLKQIFWYMVSVVVLALVDIAVFVIAIVLIRDGDVYEIVMGNFKNRYSASILSIILFVVLTELYYKIRRQRGNSYSISPEVVMCASVAVVIIISFVYNLMNRGKDAGVVIIFFAFLLVIAAMLFAFEYYLWSIKENESKQRMLYLILEEDQSRIQHYEQGRIVYTKIRQDMHDAKHHLTYLKFLAEEDDYDKMKQYIMQIRENR